MKDSAELACRDYVRRNKEIRELTRAIGNALLRCRLPNDEYSENPDTHLRLYYANANMGLALGANGPFKGWEELQACEGCMTAHKLIQERKHARSVLGSVKRRITKFGKDAE